MLNHIVGLACIIILLIATIVSARKWHESYLGYLDCFLINEDHKILDKLWRLFRAYVVLGGILAVALAFIKTDFDVMAAKNCFYLYFLSSCFFLFVARVYTTTKLISTEPNAKRITRHMNHINFLAFFGMITGILGVLVSIQSPEIRERWIDAIDATYIIELGVSETLVPVYPLIIGTISIPLFFSVLELSSIAIRRYTTT